MAILKTDLPEMVTAASAPLPVCAKTDLSLPHPTDSLARVLRLEWLRQVFSPTSVDWVEVAA